jgi:Major Facilitator Superfamily
MTTPSPPATAAARADAGLPSSGRVWAIIVGLLAGILLAALDQTIVATSLRTIADDLQGLQLQAWATTAYLVTATVTTPLYGKLGDLYGRKNLYLIAITVFVVGSVLCTLSTSMYELAIYRAVQGLGAGGLFTLALAIIGDLVPPRERARYQGLFIAVFGTSNVLGPLVGGFLAGADSILGITGWRWVFLVNVPVGVIALALVWFTLRIPHVRRPHRLDVLGAMLLVTGVVPLLLVAEQGRNWGWGSPGVVTLRRGRSPGGGRGAGPAAAVPVADGGGRVGGEPHRRDRDVRRPGRAAALPADRQGPDPDRGGAVAAAADRRDHGRGGGVRPGDLADRPLPRLPDRGLGPHGGVARAVRPGGRGDPAVVELPGDGAVRGRAGVQHAAGRPRGPERGAAG